ncbi:MAG TPA: YdcF family protein, partial [Longimicrobiaceae bacterium]|nr:YdcF family protein [Longimicrobiaceae bacterium]
GALAPAAYARLDGYLARVCAGGAPRAARVLTALLAAALAVVAALAGLGPFLDRRRLPAASADAALVFGASTEWKARARWTVAAELYHAGVVLHVVVSGGVVVPGLGISEAEWFRRGLLALGVPGERILLDERATHTGENAAFTLPVLLANGFRSVVLVMSDYEGIRAHLTARKAWRGHGIRIYDRHAPSPGHWGRWRWWLTREGRRWTWYTVTRLFRYRLLPYLWLRGG